MVILPKLDVRVRFPSPAPLETPRSDDRGVSASWSERRAPMVPICSRRDTGLPRISAPRASASRTPASPLARSATVRGVGAPKVRLA